MLEVLSLGCIRGTRRLFQNLSFSATPGELVEVRGPNGSGKTSLLRILCGLASPAAGEVRWSGKNILALGEEYFGSVAYLAHQNGVKDELTAIENLRISAGVSGYRLYKGEEQKTLEQIGLTRQRDLPARVLSAGQRRRLALGRLLTSNSTLWILDEVLTSLDDAAMKLSGEFITGHLQRNGIAIVATHQELNLSAAKVQRIRITP
jgi:heme exporter protein A